MFVIFFPFLAPCAPVISSHEVDCVSNTALVIWDEDANAESVTVTATSQDNGDTVSCSSSDTSCILQGLLCGHTYNVQAAAQGANCLSDSSTTTTIVTGKLWYWSRIYRIRTGDNIFPSIHIFNWLQ